MLVVLPVRSWMRRCRGWRRCSSLRATSSPVSCSVNKLRARSQWQRSLTLPTSPSLPYLVVLLWSTIPALRQKDEELISGTLPGNTQSDGQKPRARSKYNAYRPCLWRGVCAVWSARSRLSGAERAMAKAERERDDAVAARREIEGDLRHITAHRQQLAYLRSVLHQAKGKAAQHSRAHTSLVQPSAADVAAANFQSPLRMAHLTSPAGHTDISRSTHAPPHADTTASSTNSSAASSHSASVMSPLRTPAPATGKAQARQPQWFTRLARQQPG